MKKLNYEGAAAVFASRKKPEDVPADGEVMTTPVTGGLINHSWQVRSHRCSPFLLQRINTTVFRNPQHVQQNYINIWQYAEFESSDLKLPTPLYFLPQQSLYQDIDGNYWRAFEFIDDAFSISVAQKPSQAKATAKTFARFTAAFDGFDTGKLKVVIPNFHNLAFRYQQFEDSLKCERYERLAKSRDIVAQLKERERYKFFFELIQESPEYFRTRVMHHDAKIANVLFNKLTGRVICAVDFDTVMPGYYFSDLGDIIRSMACSLDENATNFEELSIRPDFYEAIVSGYLDVMKKYFTDSETKYIHHAGILMIYMQALRFITDYLNGDIYYRIHYNEQNYDRAMNQLCLLKKLEQFLEQQYQYTTYKAVLEK